MQLEGLVSHRTSSFCFVEQYYAFKFQVHIFPAIGRGGQRSKVRHGQADRQDIGDYDESINDHVIFHLFNLLFPDIPYLPFACIRIKTREYENDRGRNLGHRIMTYNTIQKSK